MKTISDLSWQESIYLVKHHLLLSLSSPGAMNIEEGLKKVRFYDWLLRHPEGESKLASYIEQRISSSPSLKAALQAMDDAGFEDPDGVRIARVVKILDNKSRASQRLYEMTPHFEGNRFVVVSACHDPIETFIFPANESGEITSYEELCGSTKGILSHEYVLMRNGYHPKGETSVLH